MWHPLSAKVGTNSTDKNPETQYSKCVIHHRQNCSVFKVAAVPSLETIVPRLQSSTVVFIHSFWFAKIISITSELAIVHAYSAQDSQRLVMQW
jgi:hypothetical protein